MPDKEFDVFISYAHEDADIALAIANSLQKKGLKVWIDKSMLKVGNSIVEEIGKAIKSSKFGILILSHYYLKKQWPTTEFRTLLQLQLASGHKIILPVWHNLNVNDVRSKYPFLVDIKALVTNEMSIDELAKEIFQVVKEFIDESTKDLQLYIKDDENRILFRASGNQSSVLSKTLKPTKFRKTLK